MTGHLSADELRLMASQELEGESHFRAIEHLAHCSACRAELKRNVSPMGGPGAGPAMRLEDLESRPHLLASLRAAAGRIFHASHEIESSTHSLWPGSEVERLPLFATSSRFESQRGTLAAAPPKSVDRTPPPYRTRDGRIVIRFQPHREGEDLEAAMIAHIDEMGAGAALVFPDLDLAFPVDPDGRIRLGGWTETPEGPAELWRLPARPGTD